MHKFDLTLVVFVEVYTVAPTAKQHIQTHILMT